MFFLTIVCKNLLNRPVRSLLTIAGIAVGVAAVVAMIGIAWGFERGWERIYSARGTDLIVSRITSQSPLPEVFGEDMRASLLALPGVREASGVLDDLMSVDDAPMVLVFGWEPDSYLWDHLTLAKGRYPTNSAENCAAIGSVLADMLGKSVGDRIRIDAVEFSVSGVFESSAFLENGTVVMALPRFQSLTDNRGKVRHFNLKAAEGTAPAELEALRKLIPARYPGLRAYTAGEIARNNSGIRLVKAMSWATSVIALMIGAIGVMNTMLMSVFERIREIGILLAVGWRRSRIVLMILCESVLLSVVGGAAGIVLGLAIVRCLQLAPVVRGKIEGEVSASLLATAMLVAVGVGLLGGLYPAYRSSRLQPTEALRHE